MIYFYNHDYKKALEQLELTLREFRDQKYQSPVLNDYEQALLIKLLVRGSYRLLAHNFLGQSVCSQSFLEQIW